LALRDTNGGTGFKHVLFDTNSTPQPAQVGMIEWNTYEGTLNVHTDVSDVTIQIGQETILRSRNNTGALIPKGTVVYFSGSLGNKVMIWPAIASSDAHLNGLLGVTTTNISDNTDSYVTLFGKVNELNTSMYDEGTQLYLSDTAIGQLTTIPPTGSSYSIRIGRVLRSHTVSGSIIIQSRQDFHAYDEYQTLIALANGQYTGSLNVTGSVFVTGGLHVPSITFDTTDIPRSASIGELVWDNINNTLQLGLPNEVDLQIGQELHVYGDNFSGKDIKNGDVVRIEGSSTNRIKFIPAISKYQSAPRSNRFHPVLGMATQDIPNNTSGYITTVGTVHEIDTSTYSEGSTLYLSNTASGSFISSRPPIGWDITEVGTVISSDPTGSIFCSIVHDTRFDDITGIDDSTPYIAGQMWKANGDGTYSRTQAFTGSLLGTSSYSDRSTSASYSSVSGISFAALTSSYVTLAQTASYISFAQTASYVSTASFAATFNSGAFAITASTNTFRAEQIISGGLRVSASWNGMTISTIDSGDIPVASIDAAYNCYAGVVNSPTIVDMGGGTMSFDGSGSCRVYRTENNSGIITRAFMPAQHVNIPANITSYVDVRRTSDRTAEYIVTADPEYKNGSDVLMFLECFYDSNSGIIHYANRSEMGRGMPNKHLCRLFATDEIKRETGLNLSVSGSSRVIEITDGKVWVGIHRKTYPSIKSDVGSSVPAPFGIIYHSSGSWSGVSCATMSNALYDDGTALAPLPYGGYNVAWIYKYTADTATGSAIYILGPQSGSLADAQAAGPISVPTLIEKMSILVGKVIFASGSNIPALVESAFTTQFNTTPIYKHGDLSGLEADDHPQYLSLNGRPGEQLVYNDVHFIGYVEADQIIIGTGSQILPNAPLHVGGHVDSYFQSDIQNTSSGSHASADWIIGNDKMSDTEYYLDVGINSSTFSDPAYDYLNKNDSYILAQTASLVIGILEPGDNDGIAFVVDGVGTDRHFVKMSPNKRMSINKSGAAANATLDVVGTVFITGSLMVTNTITGSIVHSDTSSYIETSSWSIRAISASYVDSAKTASYIATASYAKQALSSSYVHDSETASYALVAQTLIGSIASASYALTASVANVAITASYALTAASASTAISSSYAVSSSYAITSSFATTASYIRGANVDIFQTSKDGTSVGGLIVYEHFLAATTALINTFATTVNGTNAAGSLISSDIGHPGIVQLTTGTTATGRAMLNAFASSIRFGSGTYTAEAMILLPTTSNATNRYTLYIGFGDNAVSGDMVDGAYFQYNDANSNNWQIKTSSNSVRTTTTTTVGIVGNTWTKLKVVVADVQLAYFYVNDVLVGSINNNVPQGSGRETGLIFKIEKSAGTTARTINIDYCKVTYN